jgi:hypothetical protein
MKAIDRSVFFEILKTAQSEVVLIGIVPFNIDWESVGHSWINTLSSGDTFKVKILCESDNTLFAKSFTTDSAKANKRYSYTNLKFIRDNALFYFNDITNNSSDTTISVNDVANLKIIHIQVPFAVASLDNRLFLSFWLDEFDEVIYEIAEEDIFYRYISSYLTTNLDDDRGGKYSSAIDDESLELFDHDRIPRGIYPRASFYDTDYSQLVVWGFIFDRYGRLLIHRRANNAKDNRGMWDKSVGGHPDFSEDIDTSRAIAREVIEELFTDELKSDAKYDVKPWKIDPSDMIYLGEWLPNKRKRYPFDEVNKINKEWIYFRLPDSQRVYSPRILPNGSIRRLRVIADVFLFISNNSFNEDSLGDLHNSFYKLIDLQALKTSMDLALSNGKVPKFDNDHTVPKFTPDLVNIMTGELRDTLDEFSNYIKQFIRTSL